MKESLVKQKTDRMVVIVQRVLPHYRIAFFSRLSQRLSQYGIQLKVLYGQESPGTVPCTVHPEEDWAEFIENRYLSIAGIELVWQKCMSSIKASDLVIVEQANRLLVNYILLALRAVGRLRLAYWGHGCNLQSTGSVSIREWLKVRLMKSVDWWFVYTQLSANIVQSVGYPPEHITIVENSIDTEEFAQAINSVTPEQIKQLRERLGLGSGSIALYCGGMYPEKQLPFLLEAAEKIHKHVDEFNFILIGSGPDENLVKNAAVHHPWMHYVGAVYGSERATYFAMSDVMLMPGLVGLAIVDSFVANLPMITTDIPIHSPEIAYLENGKNGVMTSFNLNEYVAAIVACLSNEGQLEELRKGCVESAGRYTLNAMIDNYTTGVLACLAE